MEKKEEVGVGRGTPPSIEEIISPASNWAASGNLKGVSPPASRLLQISDWGSGPLLFHLEAGVVHKI
jgi:hypothetical protein